MMSPKPTSLLTTPPKSCPACRGSGRVRVIDVLAGTSKVQTCDVCRGYGTVPGSLTCPQVRVSGTIHVLNPGDPGYEEAKSKLPPKITRTCPKCAGSGRDALIVALDEDGQDIAAHCQRCSGTGKIRGEN
jgi:DnaJ-class molecular chaperone